jgi:hypothetical protein
MAAFTTIAAATVAVGSSVAKGIFAGDAAKTAARQAGRFELEKKQLEEESIARLEQNFLDEVRVATDIYDRKLQQDNVTGATIIEAAQEGDQRGVAATAGKVKAATDMQTDKTAEKFADQKLQIDLARGAADEKSAEEIAALMDDRAAAAGVKADALNQQADDLKGKATGAFLDAGVSALQIGIGAFGGMAGGMNAQGKAADALSEKSGMSRADALKQVDGLSRNELRNIRETGVMPTVTPISTTTPTTATTTATSLPSVGGIQNLDMNSLMEQYFQTPEGKLYLQQRQQKEAGALEDFNKVLSGFGDFNSFSNLLTQFTK